MEERLSADPLDADAWVALLAEASEQGPADYRPLFERCVSHFPSAACVWYQWLEAELRGKHTENMEGIFEQCLLRCPHVELWRLYLRHLKHEKRCVAKELQQAYELLLEAVGMDVNAGALWGECTRARPRGVIVARGRGVLCAYAARHSSARAHGIRPALTRLRSPSLRARQT